MDTDAHIPTSQLEMSIVGVRFNPELLGVRPMERVAARIPP